MGMLRIRRRILYFLSSLQFTICCLILIMILLVIGIFYQADFGVFAAKEKIYRAFFIYWKSRDALFSFPIFPGGYFLSSMFLVNLISSLICRFRFSFKKLGILFIHIGLASLVCIELVNGLLSVESLLPIKIGQKSNYSLETNSTELAILNNTSEEVAEIIFPESKIYSGNIINHPDLPFTLHIKKKLINASIRTNDLDQIDQTFQIAPNEMGSKVPILEPPPINKERDLNNLTAWIEVREKEKNIGTLLLSSAIEELQSLKFRNQDFKFVIRPKRRHFPFSIELTDFIHEIHPGTNIPKSFSSQVYLYSEDGVFDRSAYILMNQPLRYKGKKFYQAGYGEDNTISVLQVVENPGWALSYFSPSLIIIGLIYQFMSSFFLYSGKRK